MPGVAAFAGGGAAATVAGMDTHAGSSTSIWMATASRPEFPPLTTNVSADVCIVGAGIAGLSTAYRLACAGRSVVLLDDGPIAAGETERTTAHLTSVLDERYFELERRQGPREARLAAESHRAAIAAIEQTVQAERIDCDFARLDGYLFNGPGAPADLLEREQAALLRTGHAEVELVGRAPLPGFHTGPALRLPGQAQFHPLRYLHGLATAIGRKGGRIFAGTHVAQVHGGASAQVRTTEGFKVSCGAVVVATGTPVIDRVAVQTKQAAYRTYAVGLRIPGGVVPRALYWDTEDPYHYVRLAPGEAPGDEVLIVGGEDHRTGQADAEADRHGRLETWTRERFSAARAVCFRWSGQVLEPADGLAFIGRNPGDADNVFIATGTSGNGMTYGMIAGLLLTDLLVGRANPWAALYEPARVPLAATDELLRENVNTAAQYADWLTAGEVETEEQVPPGGAAVVRRGLTKIAVSRGRDGMLHRCSAVCPHLGGIVRWNAVERTWDCPAHGSRFDCAGKVVNGPANRDLAAVAE